jgi:hypothetical protein
MQANADTTPLLWALAEELAAKLGGRPAAYLKAARKVLARTLTPIPVSLGRRHAALAGR